MAKTSQLQRAIDNMNAEIDRHHCEIRALEQALLHLKTARDKKPTRTRTAKAVLVQNDSQIDAIKAGA